MAALVPAPASAPAPAVPSPHECHCVVPCPLITCETCGPQQLRPRCLFRKRAGQAGFGRCAVCRDRRRQRATRPTTPRRHEPVWRREFSSEDEALRFLESSVLGAGFELVRKQCWAGFGCRNRVLACAGAAPLAPQTPASPQPSPDESSRRRLRDEARRVPLASSKQRRRPCPASYIVRVHVADGLTEISLEAEHSEECRAAAIARSRRAERPRPGDLHSWLWLSVRRVNAASNGRGGGSGGSGGGGSGGGAAVGGGAVATRGGEAALKQTASEAEALRQRHAALVAEAQTLPPAERQLLLLAWHADLTAAIERVGSAVAAGAGAVAASAAEVGRASEAVLGEMEDADAPPAKRIRQPDFAE